MNKIFHVIYSVAHQTYIACSELTKSKGKTKSKTHQSVDTHSADYFQSLVKILFFALPLAISLPVQAEDICGENLLDEPVLRERCIEIMGQVKTAKNQLNKVNNKSKFILTSLEPSFNQTQQPLFYANLIEERKPTGDHYISINGDDKDGNSNYKNGGATGDDAIAIGEGALGSGSESIAIGDDAIAKGEESIAFGDNAKTFNEHSIAIGHDAEAHSDNGIAMGDKAKVTAKGGIALGLGSIADREAGSKGYDITTGAPTTKEDATWVATGGALSIGGVYKDEKITRQITGVAAGSEDTDAVNVAQLKVVEGKMTTFENKTFGVKVGEDKAERKLGETLGIITDGNIKVSITKDSPEDPQLKIGVDKTSLVKNIYQDKDLVNFIEGNTDISYRANSKNNKVVKLNDGFNFKQVNGETVVMAGEKGEITFGLDQKVKTQLDKALQQITSEDNTVNLKDIEKGFDLAVNIDDSTIVKSKEGELSVNAKQVANNIFNNEDVIKSTDIHQAFITKLEGITSIKYKANGSNEQSVALSQGLDFTNGDGTVASVDTNGVVKFDLAENIKQDIAAGKKHIVVEEGNDNVTVTSKDSVFKVSSKDTYVTNMQLNDGTLTLERNEDKGSLAVDLSSLKTSLKGGNTTNVEGVGTASNPYKVEVKNTNLKVGEAGKLNDLSESEKAKFVNAYDLHNTLSNMGFTAKVDGAEEGIFIKTGDTLSFKGDDNLTISRDGSSFAFAVSKTPTFDSITVNNAPKNPNDAINKQYADAHFTTVKSTNKSLRVQAPEVNDQHGNMYDLSVNVDGKTITIGENGQLSAVIPTVDGSETYLVDGSNTTVSGDGSENNKYQVNVTTGEMSAIKTGSITVNKGDELKVATVQNVADAINNSGFNVIAKEGSGGVVTGSNSELIKASETVIFEAGNNIEITQEKGKFSFAVSKTPTFDSITINKAPVNAQDATNKQYVDDGRTTVASKDNSIKVTQTGSADTGYHFDVALDESVIGNTLGITYRANGGEGQSVSLAKGFNFVDGKNTIATTDKDGVIRFDLSSDLKDINSIGNGENGAHITLNKDNRNINVNNGSIYGVKSAIADLEGDTFIDKITNGQKDFADYAVNVQDLYQSIQATKDELQFNISFAGDNGGNYLVDSAGKTVSIIGGATGPLSQNNIGVISDAKGQLSVQLAEDLAGLNSILVGKGDKTININGQAGTITGLTNTVWNPDFYVPGQAATEDQLNQAYSDLLNKIEHAGSGDLHYGDQHGNSGDVLLKEGLTFNDGKNTVATTSPKGNVSVDLKDNITLGAGDKEININGETGVITAGKGENQVKVDGSQGSISAGSGDKKVSLNGKDGTITAGDVNSQDKTHVTVNNTGISIKPAKKNEKDKKEVSLTDNGLNNGGNRITNVAAGKDPTDAINMSQLNALKGDVNLQFNQINDRIHKVDKKARAGIASAAAIATLPQEFRPGRSQMAIASTYYRGESALAIGYSRVSENSKWVFKVNGSTNTRSDTIIGVGAGYSW